jgi:curved DNA-binding protein CbpA
LRIHPDKNLDNPDATAEFQRVSEAYRILVKHFEAPEQHHHHHHGFPGHSFYNPFSQGDFSDDEDIYDEYDDYEEDDDEDIAFFMYVNKSFAPQVALN